MEIKSVPVVKKIHKKTCKEQKKTKIEQKNETNSFEEIE